MQEDTRRYFVTVKRLKNPDFYKTVQLLENMGTADTVYVPHTTAYQLENGLWADLSIPNLIMCIKYLTKDPSMYWKISWNGNVEKARVFFKFILENDVEFDLNGQFLKSKVADEDMLNFFIDNKLTKLLSSREESSSYNYESGCRTILQGVINNIEKVYQYEKVYTLVKSKGRLRDYHELLRANLAIIPDVLIRELFDLSVKSNVGYSSYADNHLVTELHKRGMLDIHLPKKVVVASTGGIKQVEEQISTIK